MEKITQAPVKTRHPLSVHASPMHALSIHTLSIVLMAILMLTSYSLTAQVAINTDGSSANGSAMLDVKSTNKGMLIPRVELTSTTDQAPISSPVKSLLVYNTATAGDVTPGFYYWNGSAWATIGQTPGTQTGQIQYWDGTAWISVEQGSSGQVLTFVNGKPTWGGTPTAGEGNVRNSTTGAIWKDRNLGASRVAQSSTDDQAYGDLYQWGRAAEGHQSRTSLTTSTLATTATPNVGNNAWNGKFITNFIDPIDWLSTQDNNLWQGVNGTNNPCPSGFRLPTEAELAAEMNSWSTQDANGAYGSPLKLTEGGSRDDFGSLQGMGFSGNYWSSTVDGTYSQHLFFNSGSAHMLSNERAGGFSVRCIKN